MNEQGVFQTHALVFRVRIHVGPLALHVYGYAALCLSGIRRWFRIRGHMTFWHFPAMGRCVTCLSGIRPTVPAAQPHAFQAFVGDGGVVPMPFRHSADDNGIYFTGMLYFQLKDEWQ